MGRFLTFGVGCAALAWGIVTLPGSDTADSLRDLESRLLRFETFGQSTAIQELQNGASASSCDTHSQRAMLLLEIPLAETALRSGAATAFDQHVQSLEARTKSILSCEPRESFAWLVAFDLTLLHGLLNQDSFKLLDMSYDTSSNEAWISIRRANVALPLMLIAPEPLQKRILKEFTQLIRNGFMDAAAHSYLRSPQQVQSLLQTSIEVLDARQKQAFADALKKSS